MSLDRDYPRMLFHRSHPAVTVYSKIEEENLGPEWSRTIPARKPEAEPPLDEIPSRVQLEALRKARRERHANR